MSEPPSAPEGPIPPRPPDRQPQFTPDAYPPPGYPPNGGYPPSGGVQPPQAPGGTRQHAFRTPYLSRTPPDGGGPGQPAPHGGGPGQPAPRPGGQRSVIWVIAVIAIAAILVRSHRITSTEVIVFCTLIPSVILHEVSHGVVALWCGDDTAKRAGRITLNPFRHVTLFGTIIVPIITVLVGIGWFGWAKPVPVNLSRLRSPRNQGVLVALAGPFTNIVLATACGAAFYLAYAVGSNGPVATSLGARILFYAGFINLWIAIFNLIPVPPLDGSSVIERLLPRAWWPGYLRVRPYGMLIIIGALVLMSLSHTDPLQRVVVDLVTWWSRVVHAG